MKAVATHFLELAQAEFQAEGEHQENDSEFGERLDCMLILDERERRSVRSDDNAGEDVSEHHRLTDLSKDQRSQSGHAHDDGQVLQKSGFVHASTLCLVGERPGRNFRTVAAWAHPSGSPAKNTSASRQSICSRGSQMSNPQEGKPPRFLGIATFSFWAFGIACLPRRGRMRWIDEL